MRKLILSPSFYIYSLRDVKRTNSIRTAEEKETRTRNELKKEKIANKRRRGQNVITKTKMHVNRGSS